MKVISPILKILIDQHNIRMTQYTWILCFYCRHKTNSLHNINFVFSGSYNLSTISMKEAPLILLAIGNEVKYVTTNLKIR